MSGCSNHGGLSFYVNKYLLSNCRHKAGDLVLGTPSNIFKGYATYEEALQKWRAVVMDGRVKMVFNDANSD